MPLHQEGRPGGLSSDYYRYRTADGVSPFGGYGSSESIGSSSANLRFSSAKPITTVAPFSW